MRIIEKNKLYYLSHSFRLNGKTVTKQRYMGKRIPENIEELKESFLREIYSLKVYKELDKIKKSFLAEWKKLPDVVKKKFWISSSIDFTYNTNSIEGSTISKRETEELILHNISPNKPISDVKETLNHSKVFLRIMNSSEKLSTKTLLNWHKEIFSETKPELSGKLRDYLVRVGDYLAPDWQDIQKLMKELFEWYKKNKKIHPVELAARMHYKFESIHPFGDGNGRIGRLIIANILRKHNFPILVIENKKKRFYYKAFKKDETRFVNYFFRTYKAYFKKYLK